MPNNEPTRWEGELAATLREQGYNVSQQHKFWYDDERTGRRNSITVDIALPDHKIAIEVDGGHHNTPDQRERDRKRDTTIQANGYRIIRCTNAEVTHNIDEILRKVRQLHGASEVGAPKPNGEDEFVTVDSPTSPPVGKRLLPFSFGVFIRYLWQIALLTFIGIPAFCWIVLPLLVVICLLIGWLVLWVFQSHSTSSFESFINALFGLVFRIAETSTTYIWGRGRTLVSALVIVAAFWGGVFSERSKKEGRGRRAPRYL